MGQNFNTVKTEVKRWRNFTFNGQVYDLSHLDVHWVEYTDDVSIYLKWLTHPVRDTG